MIVAVILPVVVAGITMAVITSLRDDTGVSTRLSDSHDAQITSAYFVRDVQSASDIYTGSSLLCGSGTQVLGLEWNVSVGTPTYVSYVTETVGSTPALVRNLCRGATKTFSTVSHDIASTTSASISLTCSAADSSCAADAAKWPPLTSVDLQTVQLQVTETSGYVYTLDAAPRQDASAGASAIPPGSTPPTLLLLGMQGTDASCAGSGTGTVTINGTAALDSSSSPAFTLGSNNTATAGEIYAGSSSPLQGTYTSTSTTPYQTGPPMPDPYAGLPDPNPTTLGLPTYTGTYSKNSPLPGPGVYTTKQLVTWNQTLPSGIYIFEGGFEAGGSPGTTIDGRSGVLFFIGIPDAAPGTTQTADFSIAGNNIVELAPDAAANPWGTDNIVVFQSRTDSTPLNTSGNSSSVFTTGGGIIYAPDAIVNTSGNGASTVGGIVSQGLTCGGNGNVTIGNQVQTTTTLSSSPANPTSGQPITYTAAVTAADGLTPAGTVTFTETPHGSTTAVTMCTVAVPTNGKATCTTSSLTSSGSPYTVSATYGGNTTFTASSATTTQTFLTPTSTSVSAQPGSPTTGGSVVLTAAVSPTPDGGSVAWSITDGSGASVPCSSTTTLTAGSATCTIDAGVLSAGASPYAVSAVYSGDQTFATSTGTLTLTVGPGGSTTAAAASATSVAVGSPVSDTATVSGSGTTPTGAVQFYLCSSATTGCNASTGTLFDTETLTNGQAVSTGYIPANAGSYCFAAVYGGDTNYTSSSDTTADQCFTAN